MFPNQRRSFTALEKELSGATILHQVLFNIYKKVQSYTCATVDLDGLHASIFATTDECSLNSFPVLKQLCHESSLAAPYSQLAQLQMPV